MSNASAFTPSDLRAFEAAAPTATVRDLVRHGNVQSPSPIGAPGPKVDAAPKSEPKPEPNRTGWSNPTPLGPQPGINLVDRLVDAADREERRRR
jgi:hypothetical protein